MSYDEEQQRRSRLVVETPNAQREEYYTRTTRAPERTGYSTGVIAFVALVAIAATALIMFFLMNRSDATNSNVSVVTPAAQPTPIPVAPTPMVVAPPVQQQAPPPVIVQQPPPTTQPAPVIVTPPPATSAGTSAPPAPAANANALDDATIESRIDKLFTNDADLKDAGITVTVIEGKATLIGTVKTPDLKARAERIAQGTRGVKSVDNKIMVEGSPQ
jgi:hypothetical protein